jgi:hypothetical protein
MKFDGFKVVSVDKSMSTDGNCNAGCTCDCNYGCGGKDGANCNYGWGGNYGWGSYYGYDCNYGCGCKDGCGSKSGYNYWYGYNYGCGCNYGYGSKDGYDCKSGYSYNYGYGYKDGCKDGYSSNCGCSCNSGDDCGKCEEKCTGIKSLTLKYIGECCGGDDCGSDNCNVLPVCEDGQGDGCNVPSNCCNSSTPESPALCEQFKTVTIELKGKYCNLITFQEIVGEIKQPVSGCCLVPTYVYKYSYQSDFSLCGLFDSDQYTGFSGTFTWR